ncbi:MAG: zinc-binding dehydrogenase [Proteobacteria bacterium]|nr:zinc-binding dehydrogenase [Pseudomonadota bacterium]
MFLSVSGSSLQSDPRCIKKGGRWLIDGSSGGLGTINPSEPELITKSLTIIPFSTYSVLGMDVQFEMYQFLKDWLANEELEWPTKVFKLEEVGEAQAWIENRRSCGKLVLEQ